MNIYPQQLTTPYIYRLYDSIGNWYIGSRTAKNCHPTDLGVKYFTSSKEIQVAFKNDTQHWTKEILYVGTINDNIEELEGLLLEILDAKNDPKSYNKHNNEKLSNNNWNCSKAGKLGIQKMTTEDRRRGGLKNGLTGHNKKIASSGGKAFAKRLSVDEAFRQEVINRGKETAKVKKQCKYCSMITNRANISRWHDENCKEKK
jgi:hypothetical protein